MHRSPTPLHGQASQTRLQIPSSNTISLKEWEAGNLTGMATLLAAHGVYIDSVMFSLTILYYLKKKHFKKSQIFLLAIVGEYDTCSWQNYTTPG